MNGSLAFLQDNERQALAEYIGRLLAADSRRIQNVILFGSKARGDLVELPFTADVRLPTSA